MRTLALAPVALATVACSQPSKAPPDRPAVAPDAAVAGGDDEAALEEQRTAAIEQAMGVLDAVAHQCWAAAATDDYQLAGDVSILVSVDDAGVGAAEVRSDTTNDEVLTRCLVSVVGAYAWPPPMYGGATLLPFAFAAPNGQNLIDRALVPEVASGARVLLDAKNSGNAAVSMFELTVPAGETAKPTASARDEVWIFLDEPAAGSVPKAKPLDAIYLPAGAARAPAARAEAPLRVLIVSVPGGTEDATRASGVLPASPAKLPKKTDKKAVRPFVAGADGAFQAPRPGVGTVVIMVEPDRVKGAAMAVSTLDLDATAAIPTHVHDGSTEVLYLLEGGGSMTIDGVELPVTATSVVQIPAGVAHSFTASAASRAIQIYTPPGPEQRFKQK
jgi:quercetin dioxygenase-like cupin family protein